VCHSANYSDVAYSVRVLVIPGLTFVSLSGIYMYTPQAFCFVLFNITALLVFVSAFIVFGTYLNLCCLCAEQCKTSNAVVREIYYISFLCTNNATYYAVSLLSFLGAGRKGCLECFHFT